MTVRILGLAPDEVTSIEVPPEGYERTTLANASPGYVFVCVSVDGADPVLDAVDGWLIPGGRLQLGAVQHHDVRVVAVGGPGVVLVETSEPGQTRSVSKGPPGPPARIDVSLLPDGTLIQGPPPDDLAPGRQGDFRP